MFKMSTVVAALFVAALMGPHAAALVSRAEPVMQEPQAEARQAAPSAAEPPEARVERVVRVASARVQRMVARLVQAGREALI